MLNLGSSTWHHVERVVRKLRLEPSHADLEHAITRRIARDLAAAGAPYEDARQAAQDALSAAMRRCRALEEDADMYGEGRGRAVLHEVERSATGGDTLARWHDLGLTREDIVAWYDLCPLERRARIAVHRILLIDTFRTALARGLPPHHAARVARRLHPRYARSVPKIDRRSSDPLLPRELEPRVTRHVCARVAADRDATQAELRASSSFNAWAWDEIRSQRI